MGVAVVQLAPRIANSNNRLAVEHVRGKPFRTQPGPPSHPVISGRLKPLAAAFILHERSFRGGFFSVVRRLPACIRRFALGSASAARYDRPRKEGFTSMSAASSVKAYRGLGMEGFVAKWYANLTKKALDDFKTLARQVAEQLPPGAEVLEVAPGPGYFAIELAKLGDYRITGLDISATFVEIAHANASRASVEVDFRRG